MSEDKLDIQDDRISIKRNKVLLSILALFSSINAIVASLVERGVYADGVIYMLSILNSFSHGVFGYSSDIDHHPRLFINLINQLPINIVHFVFGVNDKQFLMIFFSLPLFIFPLLALAYNFMLSYRTKRYDIAILGLGVYFLSVTPSALYSIAELRLAVGFYIILLNYLVGKINYTKFDIGIILFLVLIMFNSHELVLIIGSLFFIISLYYAKQEEIIFNRRVKYFIGFSSLAASLFMVYWFLTRPIVGEAVRFVDEAISSVGAVSLSFSFATFISLLLIYFCVFYKSYFSKTFITGLILLYTCMFLWFFSKPHVINSTAFFSFRTWPCLFCPLMVVIIYVIDRFKIKVNKAFYTNVLSIICILGTFYTVRQLNHSYRFYKDYKVYREKLAKMSEGIVTSDELADFYSLSGLSIYHTMDTYTSESILFSKNKKINSIIVPSEIKEDAQYDISVKGNKLSLPYVSIDVKNKYWDLTNVKDDIKKL